METAEIKEPERCYGCGRAVSCRWCNNCAQPANSPSIDRIRELEQEVERLKKLADDFRAWLPRLCDRCKKVAIGFPFDGSSTADPGYHHGEQRLCEGCYYDPELATPAQPAKPETGKANIPVHPGSFAAKVAHELADQQDGKERA